MNYFKFSEVDWDEINEILGLRHWHKLARKASRYTRITHDKIIIDLQEICINGAQLNLDTALKRLRHDMIDDWFLILCDILIYVIETLYLIISVINNLVSSINFMRWRSFIFQKNH